MVDFKKKLTAFYGKDYGKEPKTGGFFSISEGVFIHNTGYKNDNPTPLDFSRTDGKKKRTAAGKRQETENKNRFFENLERLGIIWIDNNSTKETYFKIARFFTNSNSPKMKKLSDRLQWAERG